MQMDFAIASTERLERVTFTIIGRTPAAIFIALVTPIAGGLSSPATSND